MSSSTNNLRRHPNALYRCIKENKRNMLPLCEHKVLRTHQRQFDTYLVLGSEIAPSLYFGHIFVFTVCFYLFQRGWWSLEKTMIDILHAWLRGLKKRYCKWNKKKIINIGIHNNIAGQIRNSAINPKLYQKAMENKYAISAFSHNILNGTQWHCTLTRHSTIFIAPQPDIWNHKNA